jgi:hypothetical protein
MGLVQHAKNSDQRNADLQNVEKHPHSGGRCHVERDNRKQPSENRQQNSNELHVVPLLGNFE